MRQETASYALLGGLIVLSLVCVFAATKLHGLAADLGALTRIVTQPETKSMQEIVEEVTRPNGRTCTVRTVRLENESEKDFVARHDAAVAALMNP